MEEQWSKKYSTYIFPKLLPEKVSKKTVGNETEAIFPKNLIEKTQVIVHIDKSLKKMLVKNSDPKK